MNERILPLILAAGFGKRLGELTKNQPKPLIELNSGRIIDAMLWQLKKAGLNECVINLHYLPDKIKEYLGDGKKIGVNIEYSEENPILDTGGAIKRVFERYPKRPLLVLNSDAVFGKNLDLSGFVSRFLTDPRSPAAAMLLKAHPDPSQFGSITTVRDEKQELRVIQITGRPTLPENTYQQTEELIFTGIHAFSPSVIPYFKGLGDVFSSTKDLYPRLLSDNRLIRAELYDGYWCDTGTLDRLLEARNAVKLGKVGIF